VRGDEQSCCAVRLIAGNRRTLAPHGNLRHHSSSLVRPPGRLTFRIARDPADGARCAFRYAERAQVVALAAYPMQRIAMAPVDLFSRGRLLRQHRGLREEKRRAQTKQLRARRTAATGALQEENDQCVACSRRRSGCPRNRCCRIQYRDVLGRW